MALIFFFILKLVYTGTPTIHQNCHVYVQLVWGLSNFNSRWVDLVFDTLGLSFFLDFEVAICPANLDLSFVQEKPLIFCLFSFLFLWGQDIACWSWNKVQFISYIFIWYIPHPLTILLFQTFHITLLSMAPILDVLLGIIFLVQSKVFWSVNLNNLYLFIVIAKISVLPCYFVFSMFASF